MDYSVLEKPREWMPSFAETVSEQSLHAIMALSQSGELFDKRGKLARAIALHQQGDLLSAQNEYRKIIEADPNHADALHLSGIIAYQIGKFSIAYSLIIRAIRNNPENPYYHTNLGTVFQAEKQYDKAAKCYQKAIHIKPDYVDAYYNMGNLMSVQQQYEQAIVWYRHALQAAPDHLDARYNMANCYKNLKQYHQAIAGYQEALQRKPDHADSYNNMGNAYMALNRKKKATACYRKALDQCPAFPEALYNLARVYHSQGKIRKAVPLYQEALAYNPDYAAVYNNIGNIFRDMGMLTDAVLCFQKVLSIQPEFLDALNNMGNCFREMGEIEKAEKCYRTVLDVDPRQVATHSNLLYCLNFKAPHDPRHLLQEHQAWARQHTTLTAPPVPVKRRSCSVNGPIRIGFVSPDFRRHPVSRFIEPLITGIDRSAFTVCCYSNAAVTDSVTTRIRSAADVWRDITGQPDQDTAKRIQRDRIDILVDLAGHTADNRLPLFARKPARIQVSYLGYPNTTGLPAIDFRLTDAWADPPGMTDHLYAEKLVRLPSGFLCFAADETLPLLPDPPLPQTDEVVFGSFNQLSKITPEVVRIWSEILSRVAGAVLVLKSETFCDADVRAMVREKFAGHGIASGQVRLTGRDPSEADHINAYRNIDIGLDPFPYNGTTTTCEALWMGVPVITLAGKSHVARVGVSLLSRMGRNELVAESPEEYIQKAVALGHDRKRIREYRTSLRMDMTHSGLLDANRFCREFENAMRDIRGSA